MEPHAKRPTTSITLKGVPRALHRTLKASAASHHRSLNSEILARLEATASARRVDPDMLLARARALRSKLSLRLDDATVAELKERGRP
jgi:plasmid stability protein